MIQDMPNTDAEMEAKATRSPQMNTNTKLAIENRLPINWPRKNDKRSECVSQTHLKFTEFATIYEIKGSIFVREGSSSYEETVPILHTAKG